MVKRERIETPKKERAVDLFLDSGVFSAWARQTSLDIKDYCKFIKRNEAHLECYATMDVIPGTFGVQRTQKELEDSAKQSYDNQQIMKGQGLTPIPIYHQGESFKWLERYIQDGEPYIGISTAKDLKNSDQRQWLDIVFSMITDAKGNPYVKTHGFGITNISLLLRYPWFTADSTTWSLAAGFGLIYVPPVSHEGEPDYQKIPMRIIMSGRHQKAWSSAKRQYEALNPENLAWVERWMKHAGVTHEEVRHRSSARRLACLKYFNEFGLHHEIERWTEHRVRRTGLLEPELKLHIDKQPPTLWPRMRVMMATMMFNGQFSQILNKAGARNRLVSYWEIMNRDEELLHNFVQDGITDINYQPRKARDDWTNETYLSHRAMMLLERIRTYGTQDAD